MLSTHSLSRIRRQLGERDPETRAREVLSSLGWGTSESSVDWGPADRSLGRMYLSSYPTSASAVYRQQYESEAGPWWRAYLTGYRWCLQIRKGGITWCDLASGQKWSRSAEALRLRPLRGFTPEYFTTSGRIEPTDDTGLEPIGELPNTDATDVVSQRLLSWWSEHLKEAGQGLDVDAEKRAFVQTLAGLFLLHTVEESGRIAWLPRGSIDSAADDPGILQVSLRRASKALNSRVLRGLMSSTLAPAAVSSLARCLSKLPFRPGSIDLDPVGALYEQLVGVREVVYTNPQPDLFYRGDVARDDSERRRSGIYYTPRIYADLLARHLVLPEARTAVSAENLPSILDPAVGSGELLTAALRQVFSVSDWRNAETARTMLANRVFAVDTNPLALSLAALNTLRTTIRLVPELLEDERPLPALDDNFVLGNALRADTLSRVPTVDVALVNPPFHSKIDWQVPEGAIEEIEKIGGRANLAFAFLAVAARKVRPGGGIGAVLPSQQISSLRGRQARAWLSGQIAFETIVENFSTPFRDVHSYAGLAIGHKRIGAWTPRTRFISIPGTLRFSEVDVGALAARATEHEGEVKSVLVEISADAPDAWRPRSTHESAAAGTIELRELLGGEFHQGVGPAPKPWRRDLWLFDEIGNDRVRHRATGATFVSRLSTLKRVSLPNKLGGRSPLLDPGVEGLKIFAPPGVASPTGVHISGLTQHGPQAEDIGTAIIACILAGADEGPSSRRYKALARDGRLRWLHPRGYTDTTGPLLVMSRATRSPAGARRGTLWSIWLSETGDVVPIAGIWARTSSLEAAVSVAVWLNSVNVMSSLAAASPARNLGTTEPLLSELGGVRVPDLTAPGRDSALQSLMSLYDDYRSNPTPELWASLIDAGERLWDTSP